MFYSFDFGAKAPLAKKVASLDEVYRAGMITAMCETGFGAFISVKKIGVGLLFVLFK